MKAPRGLRIVSAGWTTLVLLGTSLSATCALGHETGSAHIHFQRPQVGAASPQNENLQFRPAREAADDVEAPAPAPAAARRQAPKVAK
ncbi:MAG: hypothetical protein KDA61_18675, partial [Planctomycetales bacterium]|nr:hypothetical protein [Planctomycetales bacterium]